MNTLRYAAVATALLAVPATPFAAVSSPRAPSSRGVATCPAMAPALRRAAVRALSGDDDEAMGGAYRQLGITEDATYDEIMDSFMELTETYAHDIARLGALETAKEKILDNRLRQRMAGTLRPEVADSPWDAKPVVRTPIMEIANAWRKKLILPPSPRHAGQVFLLLGGLSIASWLAPSVAGTGLIINIVGGMGFIYNRGEADVVRDDFGQIGEIRPMKPKPFALTAAIALSCWSWGWLTTRRMVGLGTAPTWLPVAVLRFTLISWAMIIPCLFVKVHTIFD